MGKLIERCAGIDIGKRFLVCCVMTGAAHEEPRSETRRFDTTVPGLTRLRNWLNEERVTDVVMESTGSYWIPVFNLLEGHVTVVLANPEEVKNRKGHKTDRKDVEHLADLLRHNHVKSSYIPAEPVRQLRDLTRRRVQLTQDATRERNRVQLLEQVNVKIGSVLTDVFGVSGLHMLLALLDGRAAPEEIAGLARGSAKRKTPQLIEAIEGNRMSDHVRFLIRGCLRHLACLEEEVEELDTEILRRMQLSTFQKAFTLLQTIPGVGQLSAATILAETGPDLDSFPTVEQMASWAGLCPGNRESAGIQKGPQTTHGNPYLCTALVQCAWAATRKRDSVFRSRFQRLAPRRGEKRAIIAVAHHMLIILYCMLKRGVPFLGAEHAPKQRRRERRAHHHLRCLSSGKNRLGRFTVRRKTIRKRMGAKLRDIKQQLRARMHDPVRQTGQWLKSIVQGHFNYYAVPGDLDSLSVFRERLIGRWWRTLRRRSQTRPISWTRTLTLADRWLPQPRVLHPYPADRFAASHPR